MTTTLKKFENITEAELKAKGVVSLADKPNIAASYGVGGLSSTQLKAWFDNIGKLIASKINDIQTALASNDAATYIQVNLDGFGEEGMTYSLQDLLTAFTDGSFAKYLMVYGGVSETELKTLQNALWGFHRSLSDVEERFDTKLKETEKTVDEVKTVADSALETAQGAFNKSIQSSTVMYAVSDSGTTMPNNDTWRYTIPVVTEGAYLWTRTYLVLNDGTSTNIYSVAKYGDKGDDVYGFHVEDGNLILVTAGDTDSSVSYSIDENGMMSVQITQP